MEGANFPETDEERYTAPADAKHRCALSLTCRVAEGVAVKPGIKYPYRQHAKSLKEILGEIPR
tara:strand:+ start:352 stop:540 length:189 start_codon:yes stop_codon:yes gene_type:complete